MRSMSVSKESYSTPLNKRIAQPNVGAGGLLKEDLLFQELYERKIRRFRIRGQREIPIKSVGSPFSRIALDRRAPALRVESFWITGILFKLSFLSCFYHQTESELACFLERDSVISCVGFCKRGGLGQGL